MDVIFFAEVVHPKHAAAILDLKRGWTDINNALMCAKGPFQIWSFVRTLCNGVRCLTGTK